MSSVKMIAVDGPRPGHDVAQDLLLQVTGKKRKIEEQMQMGQGPGSHVVRELEWLEKFIIESKHRRHPRVSHNPVDLQTCLQIGNEKIQSAYFNPEFATRHLVQKGLLRERVYDLSQRNKVFCSQWLSESQVVVGTKCNSLLIIDLKTGKTMKMACLKSSGTYKSPDMTPCGIHAIETNASHTLLATGAERPNELAIYQIPTFDPVCVGEGCHTDWIFDVKWLDDEFLVTGSRDSHLALWKIDSDLIKEREKDSTNSVSYITCLEKVTCEKDQKIRALVFNRKQEDIVALTLNARVHVFDSNSLTKKRSMLLPSAHENVCLDYSNERNVYAIGSKSSIYLLDANDLTTRTIQSKHQSCGVRSISFSGDLLTIGTGAGGILFYDLRMMNYLDDERQNTYSSLNCSEGYVKHDEEYYEAFLSNMEYKPAIYTHRYDRTSTRLFVAGGPLPANITGNYAALWS